MCESTAAAPQTNASRDLHTPPTLGYSGPLYIYPGTMATTAKSPASGAETVSHDGASRRSSHGGGGDRSTAPSRAPSIVEIAAEQQAEAAAFAAALPVQSELMPSSSAPPVRQTAAAYRYMDLIAPTTNTPERTYHQLRATASSALSTQFSCTTATTTAGPWRGLVMKPVAIPNLLHTGIRTAFYRSVDEGPVPNVRGKAKGRRRLRDSIKGTLRLFARTHLGYDTTTHFVNTFWTADKGCASCCCFGIRGCRSLPSLDISTMYRPQDSNARSLASLQARDSPLVSDTFFEYVPAAFCRACLKAYHEPPAVSHQHCGSAR